MMHSLRTRLIAACVSVVVLSLLVLACANYLTARRLALDSLDLRMDQLAQSSAAGIGEWAQGRTRVVAALKAALAEPDPKPFLRQARDAGGFAKAYIGRADKVHLSLTEVPAGYDPTSRPWYKQAASARAPVLTLPYRDVTTQQLVVTFADPLIDGGEVRAVAGADVSLEDVVRMVGSIRPTPNSFAFLMAHDGTVVTHPLPELALRPVSAVDPGLTPQALLALEDKHQSGRVQIGGHDGDAREALLFAHSVPGTDWLLVIAVDAAEATAPLGRILVVSAAATLVAGLLAAAFLAHAMSSRLRRLNLIREALVESGEGNITRRLGGLGRDELGLIGNSFDRFADRTAAMLHELRRATQSVSLSANEIASGNTDLSHSTELQAGSIEKTASAMEQLTATVKQNADSARRAKRLAVSAQQLATEGEAVVGQAIQTMGAIHQSARKIVDIIVVIDGLAFQTNVLALNAAVEAARAGEHGRGFAVVAGEARGLAHRSATAARQIKRLIDDSVARAHSGSELVERAGATMSEVVCSARRVTDIVAEISHASQEQSAGIEIVNEAITCMGQAMQQNAAAVQQAAATATSLCSEAVTLTQVLSVFRLGQGAA
jgi:methyl-accepting chemotaxis protein